MESLLVWGVALVLSLVTTVVFGLDVAGAFFCGISWGIVAILVETKIK